MMSFRKFLILTCVCAGSAHAVVISAGDGSGNTSAPADDPGFANIGTLGGATAVYLGDRWVLTASHVAGSLPGSVQFGGSSYATASGTFHRLTNNSTPGMTVLTDMVVFQLASDPGLPSLNIRSTTPTVGDTITMIGNGLNRAAGSTSWGVDTSTNPWTWTEGGTDVSGFKTTAGNTIRWGENLVQGTSLNVNPGYGDVRIFYSDFTNGGLDNEAQAVSGDSGGAAFVKNGSTWELAGMIDAVGGYSGQPYVGTTPIYGDVTAMADMSFYLGQIITITGVPEPSGAFLSALALPFMLCRRRR